MIPFYDAMAFNQLENEEEFLILEQSKESFSSSEHPLSKEDELLLSNFSPSLQSDLSLLFRKHDMPFI